MSKFVSLFLSLFITGLLQAQSLDNHKIDPKLYAKWADGQPAEFLIIMMEQADVRDAGQFRRKEEKGRFVYETLSALANQTQEGVREILRQAQVPAQSFWIINGLWAKGDKNLAEIIAALPEVARIEDNPVIKVDKGWPDASALPGVQERALNPWGLTKINADDVWAAGFTGSGVIIGGQDTGYEWQHPAIKEKYRGWNGSTADHNYNWHDAIHGLIGGGTNSCGLNLTAPCDDHSHGTHTMGTMAGSRTADSIIGVAYDAEWIGCRNMEEGDGTPATYIECFQWFVSPTNLSNSSPNPAMAPHVINNSWGCPLSEGCDSLNKISMQTVVNNVRAAGIVVVVSAGNDGPACNTITSPAAIYTSSFTVGSTTSADVISSFSSRGPVTFNTTTPYRKPNISAPGSSVVSCIGNSNSSGTYTYASYSGTSMAGPHIAGVAALIMSARPDLKGNPSAIDSLMLNTAIPLYAVAPFCGGDNGTQIPNNVYGKGRVDAMAAITAALALPVELVYFRASNRDQNCLLEWATATESDCHYFDVQRSRDGLYWENIGQVNCGDNTVSTRYYTFTDREPLSGNSYYRLNQVDYSGAAMYSNWASFRNPTGRFELHITPSVVTNSLTIDIAGPETAPDAYMELTAMDGRLIQTIPAAASGIVALPYIARGVYVLQLKSADGMVLAVERFVF